MALHSGPGVGDHLNLANDPAVRKMLSKENRIHVENVVFSDLMTKINKRGKAQARHILLTDRAFYNLKPTDHSKCRRRIPFNLIASAIISTISDEFVLNVPDEYDYRLVAPRRKDLLDSLSKSLKALENRELPVKQVSEATLREYAVFKSRRKGKGPGSPSFSASPVSPTAAPEAPPAHPLPAAAETAAGEGGGSGSSGKGSESPAKASSSEPDTPPPSAKTPTRVEDSKEEKLEDQLSEEEEEDEFEDALGDLKAPAGSRKRATTGWAREHTDVDMESFKLIRVLGRGSFGKVMLVEKKDNKKIFAMKILNKSAIVKRNQVEHTKAERQILENIDHPFLVKLRYAFQTPAKLYFVLDYMRGGELFFHLKNEGRFTPDRVKFYVAELALGIGHLHSKGIIYRDLKPENILLTDEGHISLTDFGLSKAVKPGESTKTFCGTPEYLAPEIIDGDNHGKEVDWWSLGILMYEMLVGLPPFYTEDVPQMYDLILTAPLRFPPFVKGATRDLVTQLLQRDPTQRLGYGTGDVEDIKSHPFFEGLDWDALLAKKIPPPFKPLIKGRDDTSYFDVEFTSEPVVDSVVPDSALGDAKGTKFEGFTFVEKSAIGRA